MTKGRPPIGFGRCSCVCGRDVPAPEQERRRQARSGASAPHRAAPSALRRGYSGNTTNLERPFGRGWSAGDGLSGTMPRSRRRRRAGGEGKRSESLSRSLTGRRMPNDPPARHGAHYGLKAPTANAFLTRIMRVRGQGALPCPDGRRRRFAAEQLPRSANEPIVGPRIGAMLE